ncbi:MAG: TIR domain-containing protein [Blastocatellia bacterium]
MNLRATEIPDAVPTERKQDLIRALDCNPRAIEALVSALADEPLDEIIGRNPSLWEVSDREISRDFLERLEHDLLERTIAHLSAEHLIGLLRLAVHRKSFQSAVIEIVCGDKKDVSIELRKALSTRFLMNHRTGWYSLNPIVREIALARLKEQPSAFKQAHSTAADYYFRPFKARTMTGEHSRLGASFAELRYHLTYAEKPDKLREVVDRFAYYLKEQIKSVSPVPSNREELDERIAVLSVLLEEEGAKGLEYHLAQCLKKRGRSGDLQQAVVHAARATGDDAPESSWYLYAELEAQVYGVYAGIQVINKARRKVSGEDDLAPLYKLGGTLLSNAGHTGEAIKLLQEGIQVIPADKNLFSLYQSCAELLTRANRTDEAIDLLKQGIQVIPADKGVFALYQACADYLIQSQKPAEAVVLMKSGLSLVSKGVVIRAAVQRLSEALFAVGETTEAIELLKDSISIHPAGGSPLYVACAELLTRANRTDEAIDLLKQGIQVIPADKSLAPLYHQLAIEYCRMEKGQEAISVLREGYLRIPSRFSGHSLFDVAQRLRQALGDGEELQKALNEIQSNAGYDLQIALSKVMVAQYHLEWAAAAEIAKTARNQFPNNYVLVAQEAFSLLGAGETEEAHRLFTSYSRQTSFSAFESPAWLAAFIQLRHGARAEAEQSLSAFLGRPVNRTEELNEQFLLRVWDGQIADIQTQQPCFHFPLLPSLLTGLSHEVRRLPYSKPMLTNLPTPSLSSQPLAFGASCFISYAWGGESETIVDELDQAFQSKGVTIVRDKRDLGFKGRIKEFMETIGEGKAVILIISEKYLKSKNCMFELLQIEKNGKFTERIFPVVLDNAGIYDPLERLNYVKYWEDKEKELDEALKRVSSANMQGFREDIDLYAKIRATLPRLTDVLRDMNALTTAIHRKSDFEELFKAVLAKLAA